MLAGLNAQPTGEAGQDIKNAKAGQILNLRMLSRNSTFDGDIIILLGDVFTTGQPPVGIMPGLVVGPTLSILINGYFLGGPFRPLVLLPGGNDFRFLMPTSIPAGTSVLLQGMVLTTKVGLGYATTNGHELKF